MTDTVIRVENLGKKYIIGHQQKGAYGYNSLRDVITDGIKSVGRKLRLSSRPFSASYQEEFWALKDISFEVKRGEVIGIIGRNGAGKSTLLKILSRITDPTTGKVNLKGRVASLLEVGTGFHSELTGRENIFLNGAVLGMRKSEIIRRFDEIVAFSEVEKFLDTPVKRYSSGMYMRLAFAVAAHLEPEILIIDEVLAVGDSAFQQKCLGKMKDVTQQGQTVLLVSHNLGTISNLCKNAVYLEKGEIKKYGNVASIIPLYLESQESTDLQEVKAIAYTQDGDLWEKGSVLAIKVFWDKYKFAPGWECDIACYTLEGLKLFAIQSQKVEGFSSSDPESNSITFFVRNPGFAEIRIRLDIGIRAKPKEAYSVMLENCLILNPSGKLLPQYRRDDVILVPEVSCLVDCK